MFVTEATGWMRLVYTETSAYKLEGNIGPRKRLKKEGLLLRETKKII